MRSRKAFQLGFTDRLLQPFILKLRHFATFHTDDMMVSFILVGSLVLRRTTELMLDNQVGIHQQDDGIIKRRPTHTEFPIRFHVFIKHVNIEVSLYGINGIKNSISFGSLPMPVLLKILREHLFDRFFDIFFHKVLRSAFKVNCFYYNLKV